MTNKRYCVPLGFGRMTRSGHELQGSSHWTLGKAAPEAGSSCLEQSEYVNGGPVITMKYGPDSQ